MSGGSNVPWTTRRSRPFAPSFIGGSTKSRCPRNCIENPAKPEMTIKTKWLSFVVQFSKETLRVDAELSLAAKMLATHENRQVAVQFIDSIANDLNL